MTDLRAVLHDRSRPKPGRNHRLLHRLIHGPRTFTIPFDGRRVCFYAQHFHRPTRHDPRILLACRGHQNQVELYWRASGLVIGVMLLPPSPVWRLRSCSSCCVPVVQENPVLAFYCHCRCHKGSPA